VKHKIGYILWNIRRIYQDMIPLRDWRVLFHRIAFHLKYGFSKLLTWNIPRHLSEEFLKVSYWMEDKIDVYPASLSQEFSLKTVYSMISLPLYQDDYAPNVYLRLWKSFIYKMRFAHFYLNYIENDNFSHLINSKSDKDYCKKWAKKKYWYLSDFLTDEWWDKFFPEEKIKYEFKWDYIPVDETKEDFMLDFYLMDKKTKEIIKPVPEWYKTNAKMCKEYSPQYEEGLNLFKKYYLSLWG